MAGRNCGCVGNQVDTYRMSEILINELCSSKLGRITLETLAMSEAEEEKRLRRLKTRKNRK